MDCTQVLISSPPDIRPPEKKEDRIVATLTINGISHDIFNRENTIGRGDTCNIIIKNEAISSRHAVIEANDCEEHILYDLGSTNKTKLGKTILQPNVRYFISDGANLTFADQLAVYKYVWNSPKSPKQQGNSNFTIPETPEKSETSHLPPSEETALEDDDIINSSDIDIFDEPFEEEMCEKEKDNKLSSKISEKTMNVDGIYHVADKKSEFQQPENDETSSSKNRGVTSLQELKEILSSENLNENENLKLVRLVDESVDQSCLSIYDIPTQTISDEGDLFADEKKEISDTQEADTLDPADYETHDIDSSEKTFSALGKETAEHLEDKEHALKDTAYFDEDDLNFSGRKVNEIDTQDMLCKSRGKDSDDEVEETKIVSVSNEMANILSPTEENTSVKFNISALDERSNENEVKEIDKSESTQSNENKKDKDLLCNKKQKDNNDRNNLPSKEDNMFSKDSCNKYLHENLDKSTSELLMQKKSSYKSLGNLFNDKEEEEEVENINYKEKKMKLSQMMKLSSEPVSSQRDLTDRPTLDPELNNSLSEMLTQPVLNQNVVSSNKGINISSDKSFPQTQEHPALLVNLTLSNLQFQQVESNQCPSSHLGNITAASKEAREFAINVNSSSILKEPCLTPNETLKSLHDADISDLMTQPVLIAKDLHDKEEKEIREKEKEMKLFVKAEIKVPERDELRKSVKAAIIEKESDQNCLNGTDISNLITEPVLISEYLRDKEENKICRKEKEIKSPSNTETVIPKREKQTTSDVELEGENNLIETNICDLMTETVLADEDLHDKEENKICGKEKEIKSPSKTETSITEREILKKEIEKVALIESDQNNIKNTDICDLMTQPVLKTPENLGIQEDKVCRIMKEVGTSNEIEITKSEREKLGNARETALFERESNKKRLSDTDICDLITQPVVITPEDLQDKTGNETCKTKEEIESPDKSFCGFHKNTEEDESDVSNVLSLHNMQFQPAKRNKSTSSERTSLSETSTIPSKEKSEFENLNQEKINEVKSSSNVSNKSALPPNEPPHPSKTKVTLQREVANTAGESNKTSLNDTDICDLMTQPVLTSTEDLLSKKHNKICNKEVEIESPMKPFYGFVRSVNDEVDDVSNMLTQPVFLTDEKSKRTNQHSLTLNECPSDEENMNNLSLGDMLTQPVLPPRQNQSCRIENSNNNLKEIQSSNDPLIEEENQRTSNTILRDLSFSDMLTQPALSPDRNVTIINKNSEYKEKAGESVKNSKMEMNSAEDEGKESLNTEYSVEHCEDLKTKTLSSEEINQNLNDESISDMLTQPVILEDDVSHQKSKKRSDGIIHSAEIVKKGEELQQDSPRNKGSDSVLFNISTKAELPQNKSLPTSIKNDSNNRISNKEPEIQSEEGKNISRDCRNRFTKPFKKKFSKQAIASSKLSEQEVHQDFISNTVSDKEKVDKKEFTEAQLLTEENRSSNHNIISSIDACTDNQDELIMPKNKKNITLRLKRDTKKKPLEMDSIQTENLSSTLESSNKGIEDKPAPTENDSDIVVPGDELVKLSKPNKRNQVLKKSETSDKGKKDTKIEEYPSTSDGNNSSSDVGADINSDKNIREKSNSKLVKNVSRKKVLIGTSTSLISIDTNSGSDNKKLPSEMGRGKRRRVKKIFQDFCTDEDSKTLVADNTEENIQNKSEGNDVLEGSSSNVETKEISVVDRKRKNTRSNLEDELKSKESISHPRIKKRRTGLFDSSSPNAAEEVNSVDINLKVASTVLQNKKKDIEKCDHSVISGNDSSIKASTVNLQNSHKECANLGLLESSTCLKSWNSPLNTSKMRTYSKKKSLITVAGEQSISSSFQPNIAMEEQVHVEDSPFIRGCIQEEVKNGSLNPEVKESSFSHIESPKRSLSKKTQKTSITKTKPIRGTNNNSTSSENNDLKREHEEDISKLSNKRFKTKKKVNITTKNKKKNEETHPEPNITENSEFNKLQISPFVKLERCINLENVQDSDKNTSSSDKEISSIKSRSQRKAKHSTEAKQTGERLREEKHNFPKSSTPVKSSANNSKTIANQSNTSDGEESFTASFSSNKSEEASPARRSGRKRKLNSRLQTFFGPGENIMFTGYSDPKAVTVINKLGGHIVDCPKICTVLVTDKVRRTVKFLCALALGRPIVSPQWLARSKKSLTFLDYDKYLLKDKEAEKQFSFTLKESLAKAKKTPLLQGKSIFVTNSVKPPPADMKNIVECSGGTFLSKAPTNWPQNSVIISCIEDKSTCNKYRKKQPNLPIVSAEFILSGILQQNVDPDKYIL